MKRVGVLVEGGAGNGVDAFLASFVRELQDHRKRVIGIKYGFAGILHPDIGHNMGSIIQPLNWQEIDVTSTGAYIGFDREPLLVDDPDLDNKEVPYKATAFKVKTASDGPETNKSRLNRLKENLKTLELERLVVCGGDGTFRALQHAFKEWPEFRNMVVGLAVSMDDDVQTQTRHGTIDTSVNLGGPSAYDKLIQFHINAADYASKSGQVLLHENLGRTKGWPTAAMDLAGAGALILPDFVFDSKKLDRLASIIKRMYDLDGQTSIAISEGARFAEDIRQKFQESIGSSLDSEQQSQIVDIVFYQDPDRNYRVQLTKPKQGNKLGGAAYVIQILLGRLLPDIETRVETSGYTPRKKNPRTGYGPNAYDILNGILLGETTAELVLDGQNPGSFAALKDLVTFDELRALGKDAYKFIDINGKQGGLPPAYLDENALTVKPDFTDYARILLTGPEKFDREKLNTQLSFD